jgi:ribosome-binding protein aMBF1 (putative translation factor)
MKKSPRNTERKSRLRKTSDALEIIDKNLIGDDAELRTLVEEATLNAQVAQSIYDARKAAGMTQSELAELIGTTQSVASQLENSDYEDHSLSMLRRIASALHLRVEMKLVPVTAEPQRV